MPAMPVPRVGIGHDRRRAMLSAGLVCATGDDTERGSMKLPPFEHVKPLQCHICNGLTPTPAALAALETLRICDTHWRTMQVALAKMGG